MSSDQGPSNPSNDTGPTRGSSRADAERALKVLDDQPEFENLPKLQLGEYRSLVAEIPAPTDDHIDNFAAFVSDAKSWYKHLPFLPPGVPFHFYIDPYAGLDRIVVSGEQAIFFERTEDTDRSLRLHYTWMMTENYRARFGCLSFSCEAGTEIFVPVEVLLNGENQGVTPGVLDNNPSRPVIYPMAGRPARVPDEILEAGRVELTAVIHPDAASPWIWRMLLPTMESNLRWPQETGGDVAVARIKDRCRAIYERASREGGGLAAMVSRIDPELEAILRPERERLQTEMIAAMKRMRQLLYAPG